MRTHFQNGDSCSQYLSRGRYLVPDYHGQTCTEAHTRRHTLYSTEPVDGFAIVDLGNRKASDEIPTLWAPGYFDCGSKATLHGLSTSIASS